MSKDVIAVECAEGYRLLLTFEGGEMRVVDVSAVVPFDGIFKPLANLDYFRQVHVVTDIGTIAWPNGADLCPDVLYECSTPVPGRAVITAK